MKYDCPCKEELPGRQAQTCRILTAPEIIIREGLKMKMNKFNAIVGSAYIAVLAMFILAANMF
ncbi:MAG: hypothetical protein K6E83_07195 [Clostridium sp.]|nr:hypothetical protein [Clostridium sp.]